jgi:hypothetical protein
MEFARHHAQVFFALVSIALGRTIAPPIAVLIRVPALLLIATGGRLKVGEAFGAGCCPMSNCCAPCRPSWPPSLNASCLSLHGGVRGARNHLGSGVQARAKDIVTRSFITTLNDHSMNY